MNRIRLFIIITALSLSRARRRRRRRKPPAAPPPADVKPGSITCEECPYPFPSSYLPLSLYGQDVRMAYMDVAPQGTPNGHTVMIFHGNNFAGFYFGNIIDALRKEGFRVIVPDQIGYGRSSKPIIPYSLNDMARNSRAILQSLKIDKAMIVGHSMGGMLATRFATQYPAVAERVVIYNPIGLVDTPLRPARRQRRRAIQECAGRHLPEHPQGRPDALRRAQPGGVDAEFEKLRADSILVDAWRRLAAAGDGADADQQRDLRGSRGLRLGPHQGADARLRRR